MGSITTQHLFHRCFGCRIGLGFGLLLPSCGPGLRILHSFSRGPQLFGLSARRGGTDLHAMMLFEQFGCLAKGVQGGEMHQVLQL